MRRAILSAVLLLASVTVSSGIAHAQRSAHPDFIVSADPFSPTGTVKAANSPFLASDSKIEEGEVNGVQYRFYYSDGSGFVGGRPAGTTDTQGASASAAAPSWDVGCSKDAVTDKKMCHMTIPGKNLWIWALPKAHYMVGVGQDHFPGSTVTLRIDEGKPVTTSAKNGGFFTPQVSARLVSRLKGASRVTTRYMEWPNRYWVDETWDLYAFNEALQYITWAVDRIK